MNTVAVTRQHKPTNHILHLLLSIFTAGLWLPVWIVVTMKHKVTHETITTRFESPEITNTAVVTDQYRFTVGEFHAREVAKYDAIAAEREAKGDHKGAARARKVADRNRRLATKREK